MSIRTVRLDDDAERTLAALRKQTGLSISAVLKHGLDAYAKMARQKAMRKPYEIYRRLDLGSGGDAIGPAADSKDLVARMVRKKYGR